MSAKKPSREEASPDGILLREMLDAQIDSKAEDELAAAEALFKKSREEEQERIADFAEWIEHIASQPHPEPDIEYDLVERAPQTEAVSEPSENESATEPAADFDQLVSEADADTVEPKPERKEEKVENAERPL
jgi:hypothetical protein